MSRGAASAVRVAVPIVVAFGDRLIFLEFLDRLGAFRLGGAQLLLQFLDRGEEIVAPLHRRLGESRIGEMRGVVDAAPLLLGDDLVVEIARHALELGDHRLDLRDLTTLLVDLEALQADESFTRLHRKPTPLGLACKHNSGDSLARNRYARTAADNLSFTSGVNHERGSLNSG